jgi:hypothetical protein
MSPTMWKFQGVEKALLLFYSKFCASIVQMVAGIFSFDSLKTWVHFSYFKN